MDDNTPKLIQSLYGAALQGDAVLLQELLRRDPLLLHRPLSPSNTSPMHMACKLGHTDFVLKLIHLNRNLTEELDPNDKSSVLHLAARNGHLELVASLASRYPNMCFARDMLGRNPVHVAAVNDQLIVLKELLKATPAAARERVGPSVGGGGGDTIMHLCVKYNQYEALKLAMEMVGDAVLLNATNVDGNTILHEAVANKRTEMVEFLLNEKRLQKNTKNTNGLTAMDVFKGCPKDVNRTDDQLRSTLKRKKVLPSEKMKRVRNKDDHLDWLEKQRSNLMVVASLIATIGFQAGITPPGGVWQDSTRLDSSSPPPQSDPVLEQILHPSHIAGKSVMDQENNMGYTAILVCNTVGFVLSMSSILFLMSLPRKRFFMGLIMVMMWVAICAMVLSFIFSTASLADSNWLNSVESNAPVISLLVWVCLMGILLLGHIVQWILKFIKLIRRGRIPILTRNM